MLRVLAVNFPGKALKQLQDKLSKSATGEIELIAQAETADASPGAVLLYWGKGAVEYLKSHPRQQAPVIAVFPKETKASLKQAEGMGIHVHLPLAGLTSSSISHTAASALPQAQAGGGVNKDGMFDVFMKYSPAVAFIKDNHGRYCYVNEQWEKLSGLSFANVKGKTNEQLWTRDTAERMNRDDKDILEKGISKELAEWVPMKGERKFFITRKFPILDEKGKPVMVAGMSVDVTDIEKARHEREITERKYRRLIDTSNDGMVMVDPETFRIIEFNKIFAERLGYTPDELLQLKITDINQVQDMTADQSFQRLLQDKQGLFERTYIRKDGSTFPVEVSTKLLDLEGKQVMAGFIRDITERRKAEQALRDSEFKYRNLIEAANDAIFVADAQTGILIDANTKAEAMTGLKKSEIIGMHQTRLHPENRKEIHRARFNEAVRTGHAPEGYSLIKNKDGSITPVEVSVSVTTLDGRKVIIGIFRDITNRLKAENQIKRVTEINRLLKEIAVETNEATAAENALLTAIIKIREFTGWELGHVYLVEQDGNIRSSGLITCADPELRKKFARMTAGFIFGPAEGLPGLVCSTGKPAWFGDISRQTVCVRDRAMLRLGLNAAFAFPVMEGKKAAAALEFFAKSMEEPDEMMLEAINGLALQLGRVTERKKNSEKLQLAQRIIETAKEGIVITDAEGTIQSVNRAFTDMTGYLPEEAIGNNPRILKSGKHDDAFYVEMWDRLMTQGSWEGEIWNRRKDGSAYPELLSITAIKDDFGATVKYAAIFNDISGIVSSQKEIEYQAYHDALTGLPNRLLLLDRLKQAIARAHRTKTQFAILFMDLDNFKTINDSLGHITGDLLLKGTAIRLVGCLREGDTVSRFGGDEFCALVENIKDEFEVMEVASRILEALSEPYLFGSDELVTTVSVGASIFPTDANTADGLMKNADMAMYHAKEAGKGNFQFFRVAMNEQYAKRLELENGLRRAIEKKTMEPHYQPKVSLATGEIVGMEALVRWKQPDGTAISSFDFIRIAEETGMVYELDKWMMTTALNYTAGLNRKLAAAGLPQRNVSVNLSARDLERPEIVETIMGIASETRIDPPHVDLEITESAIVKNLDKTQVILRRLRDNGFNIALDDFGVGYSSMNYIRRLPINIVKMDRSFIQDLEPDHGSRLVAQAIISLAHGLGMKVVAEGVENDYQVGFLRAAKCDEMQGWLFSKAVSGDDFEKLVESGVKLKL